MLKRLVGVVCVKSGWAVQSFGYKRHLPLGRPEVIVENLDRWGLDEIVVLDIDATKRGAGPDMALLERIAARSLSTPLAFGGGISTDEQALSIVRSGADRICLDALFHDDLAACARISNAVGRQAVIRVLPVSNEGGAAIAYDHRGLVPLGAASAAYLAPTRELFSELVLVDWRNEGSSKSFDRSLPDLMPEGLQVICFGGISEREQVEHLIAKPSVSAVAIGNFLSYRELANHDLLPSSAHSTMRNPTVR